MKVPPFALERYFAKYEFSAPHLLCCSDCEAMPLAELLDFETDARERFDNLWLGYTESLGHPELRHTIASLYENVKAENVLVHAGAEEAIFNFMNVVLSPGDHVIVHSPRYQSLGEVASSLGCDVTDWRANPENGWALDIKELEQSLRPTTKVVVVNTPHNPTGYLMSAPDQASLVELSKEAGFIIFSDEVYRLLEQDENKRLPALADLDERGLSLGVMSKSIGLAGLRLGWIVTRNEDLYNKLAAFKDYTTICTAAPSEFLSTLALRHWPRLVKRNKGIIQKNLSIFADFVSQWSDYFSWIEPPAGPIAFPRLKNGSAEEFCHRLVQKQGVLLAPGNLFGKEWKNHFRVGFGRQSFSEALGHLSHFMRAFSQN